MRVEIFSKYIGVPCSIFRVLGDDVEVVISFDQSTGGGSRGSFTKNVSSFHKSIVMSE